MVEAWAFSRPAGTALQLNLFPALEALGYFHLSRWDKEALSYFQLSRWDKEERPRRTDFPDFS